jgi:hypothetical protein
MGIGDLPSYRERKRKRKRLKDKYSFRKKTKKTVENSCKTSLC